MGHVVRAPWDMGHVAWDMLQGFHGTCYEGSMGHVVGLHGTCASSLGHVVRVPWYVART